MKRTVLFRAGLHLPCGFNVRIGFDPESTSKSCTRKLARPCVWQSIRELPLPSAVSVFPVPPPSAAALEGIQPHVDRIDVPTIRGLRQRHGQLSTLCHRGPYRR